MPLTALGTITTIRLTFSSFLLTLKRNVVVVVVVVVLVVVVVVVVNSSSSRICSSSPIYDDAPILLTPLFFLKFSTGALPPPLLFVALFL